MSVYKKIAAVTAELAQVGISKDQTNTFDKYQFRGIDDVYNALAGLLAKHKLVIIPQCQSSELKQVQTSQGKPANHVRVMVNYVFVDADAEAQENAAVTATVPGEATDRGDKAENKAMSAAYKLMAFQTFCIPTEGGSADSESESIEHAPATLGEAEIMRVREALDESFTDEAQYLAYLKVGSLEEVPLAMFSSVVNQLERKIARLKAAESQSTVDQEGAPEDLG